MKKPKRATRSRSTGPGPSDALDELLDCCLNIETLAELLRAYGSPASRVGLEPEVVSNAAGLLVQQARRLRQAAQVLSPKTP